MTADDAPLGAVLQFIADHCNAPGVSPDQDIFGTGVASSLFAMQLIAFVETSFDIAVEDDDLDIDNFRSAEAVAAFVARKRGPGRILAAQAS